MSAENDGPGRPEGARRGDGEALFRGLLESAPDAMVIVDGVGEIVLVNSQAEVLFGYPRQELIGRHVENLMPERFRARHPLHRREFFTAPRVREMGSGLMLFGLRKDGSEFPIEVSLSPLETERGVLVSSAIRDLSERRHMEERLRQSEEQYRLLFENLRDHQLIMLDAEGRVASWSAAAERFSGYGGAQILGSHLSCLYPPGSLDAQALNAKLAAAARAERAEYEAWMLRAGDARFFASVVISPVRDADGSLLGFAMLTRDITARKRAEERFRGFLEAAPDAVIIVDEAGKIEVVNAQTERLFGYAREELVGRTIELLIPQRFHDRHPQHRAGYGKTPRVRAMGSGLELYGLRKDGSEFPVEIGLNPIET
ncbi:MAG TPA: PAS domain S-box protein, partial [Polyangiales bacterium]|nr:PAS domain S-box protein [Polyangiales bacterium]